MLKKLLAFSAMCCLTLSNCYAVEEACRDCRDNPGSHAIFAKCPCEKSTKSDDNHIIASGEDENSEEEVLVSNDSEEENGEEALASNEDESSEEEVLVSNEDEGSEEEVLA